MKNKTLSKKSKQLIQEFQEAVAKEAFVSQISTSSREEQAAEDVLNTTANRLEQHILSLEIRLKKAKEAHWII